jgi:hypothetical protein
MRTRACDAGAGPLPRQSRERERAGNASAQTRRDSGSMGIDALEGAAANALRLRPQRGYCFFACFWM